MVINRIEILASVFEKSKFVHVCTRQEALKTVPKLEKIVDYQCC